MSARKPLARMDSPATTESIDDILPSTDGVTVGADSKTATTENGGKIDQTEAQIEVKESQQIKEEKLDPEETGSTESQIDSLPTTTAGTEAKRMTRNSPILVASPLKKKPSDSQEQDSSAESSSTTDEPIKKQVGRPRKQSDANTKSSSSTVPPTNRLTRKAAAQDWAANTRLTRARRTSAGIGARPETPPKRKYVFKKNADPPAPAVKRKRSVSPKPNTEEHEAKISKSDDQDTDFDMNSVTVKQEILESSEEMASDVASDITEPFPAEPTSRISLRARKSAMCYSPSTRQYRRDNNKDKLNTEANTSDGKRKRLNRVRPDEDSKDSITSSTMDDLVDLKVEEKFQCEDANEACTSDICPSTTNVDTLANGTIDIPLTLNSTESIDLPLAADTSESIDLPLTMEITESNDFPLTVDTTESIPEIQKPGTSAAASVSEQSTSPDKAASLSPELVSEGVSEISVKQFYKKPEFLENNLGIEKDPKLGEIVQNVTEKLDDTVDGTSVSNDSIKEGELVFEEEEEEIGSIGSIRNDNVDDDDVNSVSTGFISPLLVEEEEEDEVEMRSAINGEEKFVVEDTSQAEESHLSGEENELKLSQKEVPTILLSRNGSVEETVESKSEDISEEGVKSESCDMADVGENEEKIISKKEENLEVETPRILEELKPVEESKPVEKNEIIDEEAPDLMEVDEHKIEETRIESIITENEENKENLQLGAEAMKEDTQEVIVNPDKESASSMSSDNQEESPSESSKTTSPTKNLGESSGEGTTPSTSPQSSKSSSVPRTPENDERLRQKERHLKTLGLLTHKAADEAIMAKQKRRKFLHNLSNNGGSKKNANTNAAANSGSAAGNGQNKSSQEYTGTLKTVIKLNRQSGGGAGGAAANEPKKGKNVETGTKAATSGGGGRRHSLKMTFQKGRGRPANTEKSGENPANTSGEDSYYTIQNEGEGATTSTAPATAETTNTVATTNTTTTATHGRKSYNRSNTTDATHNTEHNDNPTTSKKDEKEEILIPEKASSFKFHPGRLCQDQCYYCSGKFGLYDTPCHVGQIKSVERQQKILANEEKLTVDNCLCDACFRHVDRRANVPSYKKRLSVPGHKETATANAHPDDTSSEQEKPHQKSQHQSHGNGTASSSSHTCAVPDCNHKAAHSLRRKGIRKSIKKSLLNFDMSTAGTYLHLCEKHYEAVVQSSGCVLCKRRLGKNNMYHITTDTERLEKALSAMGVPVTLGQGTAVCKLCRYFANLLMKPPEHGKGQKVEFVKNYKKRLLQFYNIHDKKDTSHEDDEDDKGKEKPLSKKQSSAATSKRMTRKSGISNETEEEQKETLEVPPSPTHSTGSSVEMISDGGIFNVNETSPQRTATTSATAAAAAASNQMVLDNDVMVDYDVPMISDSSSSTSSKSTSPSPQRIKKAKDEQSKLKTILQSVGTSLEDRNDISTALRSNPNISMRELFPGEEDLGLQYKAPFGGSSSQRTPEGWTRINTFLQYDEPTRRLWEDLQKPYGNQSSFLRHLILLEKYYRNGDLILSSNASSNATVYTHTVSNRLTSFDSRSSSSSTPSKEMERRSRSLSVDKIQRQLSSNSVTITARPKEPKPQSKESEIPKQKDGGGSAGGATAMTTSTPNSRSILKTNLIASKGGAVEIVPLSALHSTSNSPHSSSGSTTPNDTSFLTKQQKILAAANKLVSNKLEASPNQKKTSLNTTPPELISLNRRPVPALNTQQMKRPQLLPKPMNSGKPIPPNVIVLPDTLTAQERLESKSWRPTLLPVTTSSHHLNNQQGPLYQTADGRRLPALVQVQSGGRPFLISIHDYNRMCILRREKLMRDQMLKGSKGKIKGTIFPPATCIPSTIGRTTTTASAALQSFNKTMQSVTAAEHAAKKQRIIMSKPANFTPIAPKPTQPTTITTSAPSTCTSQSTVILPPGTMQPIGLLSSSQAPTLSILPNFTGQVLPILNPSAPAVSTATVSGVPTNSWLWNNFPEIPDNQMLMNGKATVTKGPPIATITSMKQQSLLLDNNLMSKIPKSLTVIPQHKLMPAPSAPSGNMIKD